MGASGPELTRKVTLVNQNGYVNYARQASGRPGKGLQFSISQPRRLRGTACDSVSETESAEGAQSDTWKPATMRLATSMATVNHGPADRQSPFCVDHHDIHRRVVNLENIHR